MDTSGGREGILEVVLFPGVQDSAMTAAVVLEEEVVIYGLAEFQTAFDVLFGFLYAHCSPKMNILQSKYLFGTVKKILLFLASKNCSAQIQTGSQTVSVLNREEEEKKC